MIFVATLRFILLCVLPFYMLHVVGTSIIELLVVEAITLTLMACVAIEAIGKEQ